MKKAILLLTLSGLILGSAVLKIQGEQDQRGHIIVASAKLEMVKQIKQIETRRIDNGHEKQQ